MKPDQYKKKHQAPPGNDRTRRQIAVEAARRLIATIGPEPGDPARHLRDAAEGEFYAAKRKAAAVLGHPVRPGDLPSDSEVREQALILIRSATFDPEATPDADADADADADDPLEPGPDETPKRLADHLDRFALYAMRLGPLEAVKQNVKYHPEGDALFHSLQVFELARDARPYDEEFLLAALLHDVGKAIDPHDHVATGVDALRGAVPPRTLLLIEHHMDLLHARPGDPPPVTDPDLLEDLKLLRDCDNAGRVPGAEVGTVAEALDYLRGLEREDYLADQV